MCETVITAVITINSYVLDVTIFKWFKIIKNIPIPYVVIVPDGGSDDLYFKFIGIVGTIHVCTSQSAPYDHRTGFFVDGKFLCPICNMCDSGFIDNL